MPSLTAGRLTALWVVLTTLHKFGTRADKEEVFAYASRSSLRSGGLPIGDGLKLAVQGNFIRELGADIELAPLGLDGLSQCAEDEPAPSVRRLFLSVLMLRDPPAWVAYWQGDPNNLDALLSQTDRDLLRTAGLYPPDQHDVYTKSWWDALAVVPLPETSSAIRKAIGDAGEKLSLDFERARLAREGFPELARLVWWAAQESAAYGFDIGSFAGSAFGSQPDQRIAVEVKSVAYPVVDIFPLHLTIHELQTARHWEDKYVLHLWQAVRVSPDYGATPPKPRIAFGRNLFSHLSDPPACGGGCRWESMYIEFPLCDCVDQ